MAPAPERIVENYCAATRGQDRMIQAASMNVEIAAAIPKLKKQGKLHALRRITALGHITRMAIWKIRPSWDATLPCERKLAIFRDAMDSIATVEKVIKRLDAESVSQSAIIGSLFAREEERDPVDAVAF